MHALKHFESDDFIDEALTRPLHIVFQDEHYVAVFKPAGLIVHRSPSTGPQEPVLLQTLRDQLQRHVYPVHRLDRPTAGLILFGLNPQSAAKMVDLFTRRMVDKYYQALVLGFAPDHGSITTPLTKSPTDDWDQKEAHPSVLQDAWTDYQTLARYRIPIGDSAPSASPVSLLEIHPKTGRSHQIRRHLLEIGHPIVGDQRHGDPTINVSITQRTGVVRMLLTSMRLDFRHPYSSELQSLWVGRGSEFNRVVSQCEPFHVETNA